jgi:2-polyprenyl-3-methyl-5-hydroxy-6-metoxy-1,4-benzoquinol methylase
MSIEYVNCNLCGSNSYTVLFEGRDRLHNVPGTFAVVQCDNCELVYLNPRPDASTLADYYPDEYTPYESEATTIAGKLQAWLRRREATRIAAMLPQGARVMEIGCAAGDLLRPLRDCAGLSVCGVEMSPYAASIARNNYGLEVHTGTIFDAPLLEEGVHAVIMRHVIEHFPSPREALEQSAIHLRPGGLLLVSTPNFESLDRRVFGENWFDYEIPRHLTIFSAKTLVRMLEGAGFTIQSIGYSLLPNDWIHSLRYVLEARIGKHPVFEYLSIKNPVALGLFVPFGIVSKVLRQSGRIEVRAVKAS